MILHRPFLAFCLATCLFLSGCAKPSPTITTSQEPTNDLEISKWIGKTVQVQFRRDALGAAATLPISPTTGSINGAETSIVGILTTVESNAIVVNANNRPKWIPREVILFVESNP